MEITRDVILNFINAITMVPFVWVAFQTKIEILTASILIFSAAGFIHHFAKMLQKESMTTFLLDVISQLMVLYIITSYSPYLKNNKTTQTIRILLLAGIFCLLIVQVIGVKYSIESATLTSWFIIIFYLSVISDAGPHLTTRTWLYFLCCSILVVSALVYRSTYFPAWITLHIVGCLFLHSFNRDIRL